jgi:hypothetical protein
MKCTLKPFTVKVNLAFVSFGVGVGVAGPLLGWTVGGISVVPVGSGVKDDEALGESDGSRMKVGDGVGLGVAVGWTKIGSDGVLEAKLMSVPSPPSAGGFDR